MTGTWVKKTLDNLSASYDEIEVLKELDGDYIQFKDVETGSLLSLKAEAFYLLYERKCID